LREDRRILLAEDNPVNQKVARATLERMGLRVETVGDGREAIAAWESGRFDLILMDCQMPELDGYAATREIRRREAGGARRIPIVALTAHAMKGDDVACREAGMDDYLTKPLDRARLETCLEQYLGGPAPQIAENSAGSQAVSRPVPSQSPGNAQEDPAGAPLDWNALMKTADGDEEFARELVALFIESGDQTLAAIQAALDAGDCATLGAKAHSLKGASANLHAQAAATAAARLEAAARAGRSDEVAQLAQTLRAEIARTIDYLRTKVA
ncbi:MAG TPA: response regulator, partial [Steroidobacteraceae bacterium]|nr:response regulator [Steroidobacteraceae bacterium]